MKFKVSKYALIAVLNVTSMIFSVRYVNTILDKNNRNPRLLKFFCKIINESFKKYPIYNIISLYFGFLLRFNYKFILIIHIFFQNLQIKKSVAAAYLSRMRMCCLYAYANSYSYVFISFHTAYAYACMKMWQIHCGHCIYL